MSDTIFALATAPGRAAVAIVRVSGPGAGSAMRRLVKSPPAPRRAALRPLRRRADGGVIDRALVLWFPGPASATGEDCLEFHVHGGAAVVDALTAELVECGLRLADPGEFTRRAFERGRIDLAQAEAVADLVDAETEGQRRQALAQLDGALSRAHEVWRGELVEALALLEAAIDFPDEDLPETIMAEVAPALARLLGEIDQALNDAGRGEKVRDGYRVALIGAPNAGKSSLLNALAGREAAIVTPIPGTTRDVIEIPLTLAGFRVLLADTAGVRTAEDAVEVEGVRRARAWAEAADLRMFVVDGAEAGEAWREVAVLCRAQDLCIVNKADLGVSTSGQTAYDWAEAAGLEVIPLSLLRGTELTELRRVLERRVTDALSGAEFPAATQARHRRELASASHHLARALSGLGRGDGVELAAEDVRLAARSLARVSGRVGAEDVLDRVFARFCIGK